MMQQFLLFVQKEFIHVFRDKKTLLLLFGLPVAQILLFGFALTNEIRHAGVVVVDLSRDALSRRLTDRIAASHHFDLVATGTDPTVADRLFRRGEAKLAVVFPPDFAATLVREGGADLQVVADAADPNTANALANYLTNIVLDFQRELRNGTDAPFRIHLETRMVYNPSLRGVTNFVPGVMALVLLLVCVLMTSVSIVREKEQGTMEVLLVSPFHPVLVILSKAVPYLALSLVNLGVILLLSVHVLDLPVQGSILLLLGESTLMILTALSLGLLISNVTASQQTAMLISLMGMLLPTILLTGFMFPLENMPWPLQAVSNLLPSKWYYIIVKAVMVKGLGFSAVWKETAVLAAMTVLLLVLSIRNFKIRLA
ncbi:MAG: hypothetical protein RLY31_1260 [Bacteroidota bacterium]|jgi:ABC-2 type transport system permease protein